MYEKSLLDIEKELKDEFGIQKDKKIKLDVYLAVVKAFPYFFVSTFLATISVYVYKPEFSWIPFIALSIVGVLTCIVWYLSRKTNISLNNSEIRSAELQGEIGERKRMAVEEFKGIPTWILSPPMTIPQVFFSEVMTGESIEELTERAGERRVEDMRRVDDKLVDQIIEHIRISKDYFRRGSIFYSQAHSQIEFLKNKSLLLKILQTTKGFSLSAYQEVQALYRAYLRASFKEKVGMVPYEIVSGDEWEKKFFALLIAEEAPDNVLPRVFKMKELEEMALGIEEVRKRFVESYVSISENIRFQFGK